MKTKYEWLMVARVALMNAGLSPSGADDAIDHAGFDYRDAEETTNPTEEDWQSAYENGGARLEVK